MAIQHRRGDYSKFNSGRMVDGEIAVVLSGDPSDTDGEGVYMAFAPGKAKRIAFSDDVNKAKTDAIATSKQYAESAKTSAANAKTSETASAGSAKTASDAANTAQTSETNASSAATSAESSASSASSSAAKAKVSETNAKTSEMNAKASETNAKISETNAKTSETNAAASALAASKSASSASTSAANAFTSETNAKTSETNAEAALQEIQSQLSENGLVSVKNRLDELTYPWHDQAIMGTDSYVCDVGQMFAATLNSNTSLTLADGEGILQGIRFRIPYGSTVNLTIVAGTSGYKRIDLVVARYTKSTGAISFVVIKGTRATSSPATPAYTTGNVIEGATVVDFPLYKITLDGTTVSSVDKLFTQLQTMAELQTAVNKLNTDLTFHKLKYFRTQLYVDENGTCEIPVLEKDKTAVVDVVPESNNYSLFIPFGTNNSSAWWCKNVDLITLTPITNVNYMARVYYFDY